MIVQRSNATCCFAAPTGYICRRDRAAGGSMQRMRNHLTSEGVSPKA